MARPVGRAAVVVDQLPLAVQQVALEIIAVGDGDAGRVEPSVGLAAQVRHLLPALAQSGRVAVAVDGPVEQNLLCERPAVALVGIAAARERSDRPPKRVVFGARFVAAAVPGAQCPAVDVLEQPALAGVHVRFMQLHTAHGEIAADRHAIEGVDDGAAVAFDVENRARPVPTIGAVVVDAEEDPAKRVEAGERRGVGAARSLFGGRPLGRPLATVDPQPEPGRQIVGVGESPEVGADIRIGGWVGGDRVVGVPACLAATGRRPLCDRCCQG